VSGPARGLAGPHDNAQGPAVAQQAVSDRPIRAIARDIEKIPLKEKFGMVFSGGFGLPKGKSTLGELMQPETINKLLGKMEKDLTIKESK